MAELPTTRPSLLVRIRDTADREAWRQFVQMYGPVIYGYGRKRGLQDADAADLTQEVLRAVAATVGRLDYDRHRGSFRGWLFTLAHHKLHDLLARRRRNGRIGEDASQQTRLEDVPAREDEWALWDQEYERRLFARAAAEIRGSFHDTTWQAFWQTAVEGRIGKEVAAELGISVAAVYLAKSRIMARLRERIQELERD
jgi:RNA polymerase sigma-70 factor (ECF subfamily)